MALRYMHLTPEQRSCFEQLKTTDELALHGPLEKGQEVPTHQHDREALYVVDGLVECLDDKEAIIVGGDDVDAVLVPAGAPHGWRALASGSKIEHVLGPSVHEVLAA